MHKNLRALLDRQDKAATRSQILGVVPHHILDRAVSGGHLVRAHPSVYVGADHARDPRVLDCAALLWAGPGAARSHSTGVAAWGLEVDSWKSGKASSGVTAVRHVVVPATRRLARSGDVVAHRREDLGSGTRTVSRDGLDTVTLERCLVDWWVLAGEAVARPLFIDAVRQRLTTPTRVRDVLIGLPACRGSARLSHLLALLDSGCHSELEIWGLLHVFTDPRLPSGRRQKPVRLPSGLVYLDLAYDEEQVALELDGAAHHGNPQQRERDVRRDAELAALGWLVVRLTYARLRTEPEAVRVELSRVLQVRRHQLGVAAVRAS